MSAPRLEESFGSGEPFSVGVEEELFLVDPATGHQANSSVAVLQRLAESELPGTVEQELHACQVELISNPCANAAEAIGQLSELRAAVLNTGAGLMGSGTHPAAAEGAAEITDKDRYEQIRELLGDAAATAVAGLHVHVGMPDAETAIHVFNGLRRHLPLLQALAANSPFRHDRDTGLASAREVTLRAWPRSGVPRAMRDFADFAEVADLLVRAADVPDYTWFWWKLRPHPRLGTVEVRSLDAQTTPDDTAALVALVHCLSLRAAEPSDLPDPPPELVEEGLFRAARFGVGARLPDHLGELRPVAELLSETLEDLASVAQKLGCAEQLERLPRLCEQGGGAGRQRDLHSIAGMSALLRELTAATAP